MKSMQSMHLFNSMHEIDQVCDSHLDSDFDCFGWGNGGASKSKLTSYHLFFFPFFFWECLEAQVQRDLLSLDVVAGGKNSRSFFKLSSCIERFRFIR